MGRLAKRCAKAPFSALIFNLAFQLRGRKLEEAKELQWQALLGMVMIHSCNPSRQLSNIKHLIRLMQVMSISTFQ